MKIFSWMISIIIGVSGTGGSCFGQVVQLPSYRVFQMPLQVVVPDGGTTVAGGISRAVDYRSARGHGWLPHRTIGSYRSASSIQVSAQIIDHEQLDKAILSQARSGGSPSFQRQRSERFLQLKRQIQNPNRHTELKQPRLADSVERSRQAVEQEASALLRHGDSSYAQGEFGAARIFYRMAWKNSEGHLREAAAKRLQTIANRPPQQASKSPSRQ